MTTTLVTFTEQNIRRILHLTPEPHRTRWRVRIEDHGDHPESWPWSHYPRGRGSGSATPEEAIDATVERLRGLPEVKRFRVERVEEPTAPHAGAIPGAIPVCPGVPPWVPVGWSPRSRAEDE